MEFGSLIGIALWALIPGFIARKKGRSFWGYYFLSFLISPIITTIITLCVKNLNEEYRPEQPTSTTQSTSHQSAPANVALPESPAAGDRILFCRKCGEKLIDNSKFCRKCGTEVVKE